MDILIFKTVNEQRTKILLKKINTRHDKLYMVMPDKEIHLYEKMVSNIQYIGTCKDYMDYFTLMREARIPDVKFDEIWVLSSSYDRLYSYYEVYAVISELKYRRLKYLVINDGKCTVRDLGKEKPFSRRYAFWSGMVRGCAELKNRIIKF